MTCGEAGNVLAATWADVRLLSSVAVVENARREGMVGASVRMADRNMAGVGECRNGQRKTSGDVITVRRLCSNRSDRSAASIRPPGIRGLVIRSRLSATASFAIGHLGFQPPGNPSGLYRILRMLKEAI